MYCINLTICFEKKENMSNKKPQGINPRMHENEQISKLSVGADVEGNGGVDAVHVTTTFMKSVSLFLTSAWKASVNVKRPCSVKPTKPEPRRPRKKKMPESGNARNSAYIVKVIESLKKKTKFSRSDKIIINSFFLLFLFFLFCIVLLLS